MTDDLVNKPHFIKFIKCFKFALQLELVSRTVGDSQRPLCHRQHAPRWRYHRDTFPKAFQQVGSQRPLSWHDRNAFVLPLRHHWKPSHGAILSRPYGNYHVILQRKHMPWSVDSSSFIIQFYWSKYQIQVSTLHNRSGETFSGYNSNLYYSISLSGLLLCQNSPRIANLFRGSLTVIVKLSPFGRVIVKVTIFTALAVGCFTMYFFSCLFEFYGILWQYKNILVLVRHVKKLYNSQVT